MWGGQLWSRVQRGGGTEAACQNRPPEQKQRFDLQDVPENLHKSCSITKPHAKTASRQGQTGSQFKMMQVFQAAAQGGGRNRSMRERYLC